MSMHFNATSTEDGPSPGLSNPECPEITIKLRLILKCNLPADYLLLLNLF